MGTKRIVRRPSSLLESLSENETNNFVLIWKLRVAPQTLNGDAPRSCLDSTSSLFAYSQVLGPFLIFSYCNYVILVFFLFYHELN